MNVKKLFSFLLSAIMALVMVTPAYADDTYSITVANAAAGETYTAYKVFDIDSYDNTSNPTKASYTIKEGSAFWSVVSASSNLNEGATNPVFKLTQINGSDTYLVELSDEVASLSDDAAAQRIVQVLSQANVSGIPASGSVTATDTQATIDVNDGPGYYYVTTSLGSVVSLDSTTPTATITDKNDTPTVKKEVQEDSDSSWGSYNDAEVGQTVTFRTTISGISGVKNLVLNDSMTNLKFGEIKSVSLHDASENQTTTLSSDAYSVTSQDSSFSISFDDSAIASVGKGSYIVVEYTATLTSGAISSPAVDGTYSALNETYVKYGNNSESQHDSTTTYTYSFDIFKYTKDGDNETPLANAQFVLQNDDGQYAVLGENNVFQSWTSDSTLATPIVSDAQGKAAVYGLDADTYRLTETEAPDGYNKLTEPVKFVIEGSDTGASTLYQDGNAVDALKIENNAGSLLPSTGGMGTTIFYVVGGALVIGAAVLLVTKRRMDA